PYVCIIGMPSRKQGRIESEMEEQRIKNRREKLGKEKLIQLRKDLENAKKKSNIHVPAKVLEQYKIPDISKVPSIPIITYRSDLQPSDEKRFGIVIIANSLLVNG